VAEPADRARLPPLHLLDGERDAHPPPPDDHNTFQGVAFALASVLPGVSYERGMELANKIHSTGQAIVWSGHREAAELYWSQLDGYGLTMAPLER
jgi:ATP-dependent Clp protease adaptor protein ClpS